MLHIYFITVHPEWLRAYQGFGVFRQAAAAGIAKIEVINLRDYAIDRHGTVDDRPYGGGDGMVLRPEPLAAALAAIPGEKKHVVLPSPAGKLWCHAEADRLSRSDRTLVWICPRFAGVDQRFIERYVTEEFSLGDFIVSGGELPALCMADSVLRLLPGVLGHEDSAKFDSFSPNFAGQLEHALYTRPPEFEGLLVPSNLLSDHHLEIARWQAEPRQQRTQLRRPDLL